MGECFFWYWFTWVFPEKVQRAVVVVVFSNGPWFVCKQVTAIAPTSRHHYTQYCIIMCSCNFSSRPGRSDTRMAKTKAKKLILSQGQGLTSLPRLTYSSPESALIIINIINVNIFIGSVCYVCFLFRRHPDKYCMPCFHF